MICTSPIKILDPRFPNLRKEIMVPCKSCIPCRINHTSEWSLRLMMELQSWKSARFVTLTYRPGTTPPNKTLVKDDVSDFMKSLRQRLDRPIKMFACGEYGESPEMDNVDIGTPEWEKGHRPHYHLIIYGLTSSLEDRKACYDSWGRADEFQWFGKNWQKVCGTVTPDSCNYVAGYCQKKLNGPLGIKEYTMTNRIPPFQLQSKRLGEEYFLQHKEQFINDGYILFNGSPHPIPEVWKRKFEIKLPDFKTEAYEKEKENYLINHRDIDPDYYDWVYRKFGTTLSQEDLQSLFNRQAVEETLRARNNLKKRKTL